MGDRCFRCLGGLGGFIGSMRDRMAWRHYPTRKLPAIRFAPTGGHRPPVSPPVGVNPRVGSGQAATLATRRAGAEAPPSIVQRPAMAKRWNRDLRVPSDGGIDDACPAIAAACWVWLVLLRTARYP